ncbi:hypothetical protein EZV62_001844 [Acer yangbiense]|uniref:SWIM-type domain-containing protein n=1 Tax=Acer yangbiense TaxID=1000413 RepID=A0A5C7IVN1_9ROSI|nr:hypothetical protein EZV62_001844 [Acer yangbiense]
MLPFSVSVKIGDKVCDLGVMEADEFNIISIINDAKKAFEGDFIKEYDILKLCIIFPWSMQRHVLETDAALLAMLEEYDKRNLDNIEFNIDVIPYASEPPNPNLIGQTPNSNTETQPNTTQSSGVVLVDSDIEPDFEYIPDSESNGDLDVSLFDSIVEAEDSVDVDVDGNGSLHYDPNEMGGHHSSDKKNGATRMVRYCVKHEWKPNLDGSISLSEGQVFRNVQMVKDVVRRYAIQEGFELNRLKNDQCRYTAKCFNDTCDWRIHVSSLPNGRSFIIRSICGGHVQCRRGKKNKEAISPWIAVVASKSINSNPIISAKSLKNELHDNFGVECSSQSVYRAKKKVLKTLRADHENSYAEIRKYGNILIKMNPGSMAKVHVNTDVEDSPKFERFFVSFRAMQTGFVKGCRPLIGLDGCHLSSAYGGVLLSACAMDADNGIFPLAYCVVESENTDSWSFFLQFLREALQWNTQKAICFMTDRQKGVLTAIKNEWPTAGNRYCFRHISANFNAKKEFSSLDINGLLWQAAKEGSEAGFNWIKDDRDKPILTLMECLRRKVMVRFSEKWDEGEKMNDTISPYARRRLNEAVDDGRKLIVYHGRGEYHETVDSFGKRCLVNLSEMSCDCGQWQISGFPCAHAAAVIDYCRQYTHEYTHWYYSKEAFKLAYGGTINPIPDPSMWPDAKGAPPKPPKRLNVVGRPKKNRRREPDEGPAPSKSFTKHCKSCGSYGHNKRTCSKANQQPSRVSRNQSKKTKGRGPKENKVVGILVNLSTKQIALFSNIRCLHLEVIMMFVRK